MMATPPLRVFLDFETRSKTDIRKAGGNLYTQQLEGLLCLCYQIGTGPVVLWKRDDPPPRKLFAAIESGCEMHAHNAAFEIAVWNNHCVPKLGWPPVRPEQWHCTAAQAAACAIPRSLAEAGRTLNLAKQKDQEGHIVMLQLCKPRNPSPDNPDIWFDDPERFGILHRYCIDDVKSEVAIDAATPSLSWAEQKVWLLDQRINNRGVPIDRELASRAILLWDDFRDQMDLRIIEVTSGAVQSGNQLQKILAFLNAKGVPATSLTADSVRELLQGDLPPECKELLMLRAEIARASLAKFSKMLNCVEPDGRIRGVHLYHGATTGRWAGRMVQFQNVPQGSLPPDEIESCIELVRDLDLDAIGLLYPSVGKILSSLLRATVAAPAGKRLIVCDFASVEARGLAWLAGQQDLLDEFAQDLDVYVEMAAAIYGCPTEDVDKGMRQLGKAVILGAGYGMGKDTFLRTCLRWGLDVDKDLAELAIDSYRNKNKQIRNFWYGLEDAAMLAIRKPVTAYACGKIKFKCEKNWLWCRLPSGRRIAYRAPYINKRLAPSPPFKPGTLKDSIHFTGIDVTGKGKLQHTYGGKLAENVTQAVCRDLLADAMLRLEAKDYPVVMHVHDEVVCEVPEDYGSIEEVVEIMQEAPSWAEGFPIGAAGFESKRYRK